MFQSSSPFGMFQRSQNNKLKIFTKHNQSQTQKLAVTQISIQKTSRYKKKPKRTSARDEVVAVERKGLVGVAQHH